VFNDVAVITIIVIFCRHFPPFYFHLTCYSNLKWVISLVNSSSISYYCSYFHLLYIIYYLYHYNCL